MKLSVVVPLYNEEENIEQLYLELKSVLNKINSYEILFIDDGSTDSTFKKLEKIYKKDRRVKIIKFRKNFGQTAGLEEGIKKSKGDIIITMDGDLQNDPKDIPKMLAKINEGYDIVSGWRKNRKDRIGKKVTSKIQNWLIRKLTGAKIHDSGCTLKAYRREVFNNINLYGQMHRYVPSILASHGYKIFEIVVNHRERKKGKSKYGLVRVFNGFLDLLYVKFWSSYATRPIHFFGGLGILQYIIAIFLIIQQIIKAIMIQLFSVGPVLLLALILLVTGTLFILFGLLTEIQIRTYFESVKITYYDVEKILEH